MYAAEFIGWLVETERNECSRAQIVRDDEGRLINDSLACDRRGTERVTIVEWGATIPPEQTGWLPPGLFIPATHDKDDPSYQRPLKITRAFRDLGAK